MCPSTHSQTSPQELPDELFSQMMSALATNHDADLGKVAADFIKNSPQLIGAIVLMGGAGGAMQTQQQFKNSGEQTQADESQKTDDTGSSSSADQSSSTTTAGRPSTPPLSVEQSQKLIHNVMNRPPEQRGHPTTQADLAQAQWVVREQVRKLESQKEPLSEAQQKALADAKAALARVEPSLTSKQHVSGGRPELPKGAKLLQSSEHWFIFEQNGKKWVRFYAPEARSPNSAKKGGRGGGDDDTAAFLTPEGRIYVDEGQHRLNSVVLDGKSTISTVQGHPQWLEYEYKGPTDEPGKAPAYAPGEPHKNVNRLNDWDGEEGY
jgi:hypothetical protein